MINLQWVHLQKFQVSLDEYFVITWTENFFNIPLSYHLLKLLWNLFFYARTSSMRLSSQQGTVRIHLSIFLFLIKSRFSYNKKFDLWSIKCLDSDLHIFSFFSSFSTVIEKSYKPLQFHNVFDFFSSKFSKNLLFIFASILNWKKPKKQTNWIIFKISPWKSYFL